VTTRRCRAAVALAALCLVTACSTAAPPEPDRLAAAHAQAELPAPTFPPPTLASTTTTTATPEPVAVEEPLAPPGLVEAVRERLDDPRFGGADVGLSVWVDGAGEVVAHRADVPLRPGSTEKLLVAAAALAVIGQDTTLVTELRSDGPAGGGVLRGDLVLVGGGDPSLRSRGAH
jgi:D-alanyl-D-alanine carboxypeptidase